MRKHDIFFFFILVHTIWPMASFRCQPVTFFFRTFTLNNNRRIMKQCQWVHLNSNSKMKRKSNTYKLCHITTLLVIDHISNNKYIYSHANIYRYIIRWQTNNLIILIRDLLWLRLRTVVGFSPVPLRPFNILSHINNILYWNRPKQQDRSHYTIHTDRDRRTR